MRRYPLLSALLVTLSTLAATFGFATSAQAATVRYVALGDSYSSGTGAGSYVDSTCQRSSKAYAYLWSLETAPSSFSFQACSGATTATVTSSQLSALSSTTTLVSITVGGNDVGFADVMTDCVLGTTATCTTAVNTAKGLISSTLPGRLSTLYGKIRTAAPNARVVVLGYPVFYNLALDSGCIGLNTTKRTILNQAAAQLNSAVSAAVSGRANFVFKSVVSAFSGHQLCDSTQWIHALAWPLGSSYHPTAAGHSGAYLPAFKSVV
ncbi:SGNH family lipase [Actinocorallia aurea]